MSRIEISAAQRMPRQGRLSEGRHNRAGVIERDSWQIASFCANGLKLTGLATLIPGCPQVGAAAILIEIRRPASRENRLAASSAAPCSPDKAGYAVASGRLPGLGLLRQAGDWWCEAAGGWAV